MRPDARPKAMANEPKHDDFLAHAGSTRPTLLSEFIAFLRENKKWWLAPIVLAILILGLLVILSGTAAGPFIYTLF
jgi:hypothetical protein